MTALALASRAARLATVFALVGFATFHTAAAVINKSQIAGSASQTFTIPSSSPAVVGVPFTYIFTFQDANKPGTNCPPMSIQGSVSPNPPAPGLNLVATASGIQLTGTPTTAATFHFTFTAKAADDQGPCGTPTTFSITLTVQPSPPATVAPDVTTPQAVAAVTAPSQQLNNIQQRLDNLRMTRNPTIAQGLKVSYNGQSVPLSALVLAPEQKNGKQETQRGGGAAADDFARWGVFVQGALDIGKLDTTSEQNGFDLRTKGLTIGADYQFPGSHVLGAALGFTKASTDLANNAGDQDVKGWSISLFGEYVPTENAYIDLAMTYGQNKYDGTRNDTQASPQLSYGSNPKGNQFGVALSGGYQFYRGAWTINPYGRVEYVRATIDAFQESGGPNALSVGEQRYTNTTLTAGGQVQYAWSQGWGVLVPYARAEYQYLAQNSANDFSAQYATTGVIGSVPIPSADKSFGNVALGLNAVTARGFSGYFNFQYLFGRENYSQQSYTLGVRYEF